MHQGNPAPDALPSARALARSTLIALAVAGALLVGVVLPAEYGRDITGLGTVLGLTTMGKIKLQLEREAVAAERGTPSPSDDAGASAVASDRATAVDGAPRRDSMSVTLAPGGSIELKLSMRKDQKATYEWRADSAEVYYNLHGEPPNPPKGFSHGYAKGTSRGEQGAVVAAFDGIHGWFWRNRSEQTVHITLKTSGEYQELKQIK